MTTVLPEWHQSVNNSTTAVTTVTHHSSTESPRIKMALAITEKTVSEASCAALAADCANIAKAVADAARSSADFSVKTPR